MPQPKNPDPAPETDPAPAAEPEWAAGLRKAVEELPGKLRATVTDDDRRSIGEYVHELFERSGAFTAPAEPPTEPTPGSEQPPEPGAPAEPEPGGDSWARRMFGAH